MKLKSMLIGLLGFFVSGNLPAQDKVQHTFVFEPGWGKTVLQPGDSSYLLSNGDSIKIETLKFYISAIELLQKGKPVWTEKNSYHLVDAASVQKLHIPVSIPGDLQFDQVRFNLGIDSATNVSGALGGDLDPTQGMYWAWQSGYINFKLEGKSKNCPARNNAFQFHLGGYLHPFETVQKIVLPAQGKEKTVIRFDLQHWLNGINLAQQYQVMTPGREAVQLSEQAATLFTVDPQ